MLPTLGSSEAEAAPNSYTGSGPRAFPRDDGFNQLAVAGRSRQQTAADCRCIVLTGRRVPETSPCHVQAKQSDGSTPLLGPCPATRSLGERWRCRERRSGNAVTTALPAGSKRRPGFAASRAAQVVGDGSEQRIGSVSCRLCTWAASVRLHRVRNLGPRRRGQSKRMRSS